jgi:ABC-type Fe3+-siderophore transport system permease subunit|tara:strand:- start:489 stop:665 length:177 start_codon:yes stop_codon:yes gene_type:complete
MTFSKRQLKKAAMYSLAVGMVVPVFSAIIYLVSMAPAPIAFGAIFGLLTFPGFVYYFR